MPESAAFPNGLPEALEASVALSAHSEGSESDHSAGCNCSSTGECNCCIPRKPARRNRNKSSTDLSTASTHNKRPSPISSDHPSSQVLARVAELRPVRPRLTPRSADVAHNPSSGIAHGQSNLHSHESMLYSPYGRAYEYNHSESQQRQHALDFQPGSNNSQDLFTTPLVSDSTSWMGSQDPSTFAPSTGGGDNSCRSPGCSHHNNINADSDPITNAYVSCTDPNTCNFCLECLIRSLPSGTPTTDNFPSVDGQSPNSVNHWLRQLELANTSAQLPDVSFPVASGSFNIPSVASTWNDLHQSRVAENGSQPELKVDPTFCYGGGCQCPLGMCQCKNHSQDGFECGGGGLTFATSGERLSVCQGTLKRVDSPVSPMDTGFLGVLVEGGARSRASSTSSRSSLSRASSSHSTGQQHLPIISGEGAVIAPELAGMYSKETLSIPGLTVGSVELPPAIHSRGSSDGVVYAMSNPDSESSLEELLSAFEANPMEDATAMFFSAK